MKQFLIFLFTGASIAILDLVDSAFGNQISLDSICVMSAFTVLYWCFSALCTVGEYAYRVKLKYESECFTLQVTITLICSFILIVFRVPLSHIYSLTDTQYDLLAMCLLCKGICLIFGKLETFFRTYIALSCQNKHIIISNIIFYSTMIVADAIVIALHGECYHLVITTGIADAITVIYYLIFCRFKWSKPTFKRLKECIKCARDIVIDRVLGKVATIVSNKGFDGDLFTNISVKVNENNSGNDASGIREVHAYVYDKENKGNYKDYQLTIDNSKTVQTKYDFYYNGVKYPYSSTYKFKVNLYNEPQFRHSADLGIYIYAIDYQGNSSLTHETLKKLQNNNDKTIPEIDIPQSKPIIKDNPSNTKPPSDNNKPWDVIYHEVNECIYTTYLTAEGTNNFFAGELGIASVWTYGYVEHIDLDYDADTRYKINTEMETEIAENQLSEDNRMNRGYDIPNGINTLSTVWIQPVRIPPYVLQHLSTPSTTKQHSDGTTAYNDLLDIKYSSIGTKHSTKTDAYNSYNIQDAEYQDVHYRSGI